MYGSKEITLRSIRKKFQEAHFHIKQTDPFYPWQIQSEGTIRDLKKGAGKNMVQAGVPNKVREDEECRRCFSKLFGRLHAPFGILAMSRQPIYLDNANGKARGWIQVLLLCPNIRG